MTSYDRHDILHHRRFDCLFSKNKQKNSTFRIFGPLRGESNGDGWFPHRKGQLRR